MTDYPPVEALRTVTI